MPIEGLSKVSFFQFGVFFGSLHSAIVPDALIDNNVLKQDDEPASGISRKGVRGQKVRNINPSENEIVINIANTFNY